MRYNQKDIIPKTTRLLLILSLVCFVLPTFAHSQGIGRQYWYESIFQDITINQDSTFTVRETQTYHFVGAYHKAFREIPYNKISAITDVKVFDEDGRELMYSSSSLDKNDPASWGRYNYFKSGGAMNIEWYYDATDTIRSWVVEYKVHGGISFLKNKDELYWNLFTDYDVPIGVAGATVTIPGNTYSPDDLSSSIYVEGAENPSSEIVNNRLFRFKAKNIETEGDVTVAAGWPKGIVAQSAFWKGFFKLHLVAVAAVLLVILTFLVIFFYWYFTERHNKGRGTIIPQYEPPRNIRPAMAELVIKERLSSKTWAATMIDLAVRGYVKISEDKQNPIGRALFMILIVVLAGFFFISAPRGLAPLALLFPVLFFTAYFGRFFLGYS